MSRHRLVTYCYSLRLQRNTMFLPPLTRKIQYCGEPPWRRGGVLGLKPPGLECSSGAQCHLIHPQEVLLAQSSLYVHQGGKTLLFSFISFHCLSRASLALHLFNALLSHAQNRQSYQRRHGDWFNKRDSR